MRKHPVEPGLDARFLAVRKHLGLSQSKMAAVLDTAQSVVSGIERGRRSIPKHCLLRLKELHLDPVWLLSGMGEMVLKERDELVLKARNGKREATLEHIRYLPVLGRVPAGYPGPSPVDEVLDGYFPMPVAQVPDPDAFVLRVTSDSMTGFVEEGDFIVVSPMYRSKLKPDDLVVVRIEPGDTIVKRYIKTDQGVVFLSSNPKFKPIIVAGADERTVEVIGKVTHIIHRQP